MAREIIMTWWQILLIIVFSLIGGVALLIGGAYVAMRLFLNIFINDDNYNKWVAYSGKLRKLMRMKKIKIDDLSEEEEANGGL